MTPEMGRAEDVAKKIRIELEKRGLHKEPLGVDIVEPDVMVALQREGFTIVNGHALMCEARGPVLVRYTTDGGQTWTTLGVDLTGGVLKINPTSLPVQGGAFEVTLANTWK